MKVGEGLRQNWGPVPALALGCELSDKAGRSNGRREMSMGGEGVPVVGTPLGVGFGRGISVKLSLNV